MARGTLRVYLGAAPGVGKTYAMLQEGHRRAARGTDVVVGFVEAHGRPHTAALMTGLEVVPARGSTPEMDLDAVLARRPAVALVDELAHSNAPGSRNPKRWQDIQELLEAGIDVISTVNIHHLESVNDVAEKITGVPQHETVPDRFVRAADQLELVDMSAEALRRRLAHGNIYPANRVDAAMGNYFRLGNLIALREIALLWTADRVDDALQTYRAQHAISASWETRERVVVALPGGVEGETLVRRAARIAARSSAGGLLAVHVARHDGLRGIDPAVLADQRRLVESLGGTFHQVVGDDVPRALLTFARAENATQLVLGAGPHRGLASLLARPGVGTATIRDSGDIDVHIVTHTGSGGDRTLPRVRGALSRRRRLGGLALAIVLPILLTLLLIPARARLNLSSDVMLFLLAVVVVSLVGGLAPALVAALVGLLLLNYFFVYPIHTLSIGETNNSLALLVFVTVAILVSSVVDLAARRTRQATRSAAEAQMLANLIGAPPATTGDLPAMLERVKGAFGLSAVTMLERRAGGWHVVAYVGASACTQPADAENQMTPTPTVTLLLQGRTLEAEDQRLVGAFAAQAAATLERLKLAEAAAEAVPLAAASQMRSALLTAVGHDLRTPLAAAKAVVSSLRSDDVQLSESDRRELLLAADESLDRLAGLVDNLLDLSRLQAGAMNPLEVATALDEVVAQALDALGLEGHGVLVEVPSDLPPVVVDPGLLERVVANLVTNALRYSPVAEPPLLTGSRLGERVELRVVDRGPGIPAEARERVFLPFQRLGDTDNTTGVGLGLALTRGLVEAMGGEVAPEETPGGGLTMVVSLRAAPAPEALPGLRERDEAVGP